MNSVSRFFEFAAAHRIEGHPKCGRLHGHNYKVTITLRSEKLDPEGMVLDFGALDEAIKPLIEQMDHRYLISQDNTKAGDEYAQIALAQGHAFTLGLPQSTAEQLAKLIHTYAWSNLPEWNKQDIDVTVQETTKNSATYTF